MSATFHERLRRLRRALWLVRHREFRCRTCGGPISLRRGYCEWCD